MASNPVISIILPTYNGSKYIRQSIDSCLNQSFKNFELIIVNDCSTDDTPAILEEYGRTDSRIKVINNRHNKQLPLSLNTGFDAASGLYHTWTSDDNFYASNALEVMLGIMLQDEKIDLVYTDYSLVDDSGEVFGTRTFNNVYDSFTAWIGCGACFLYKAEVYKKNNGYNPSAFLIEDYDFFLRAFLQFNFKYHSTHGLYYYREHPNSLTTTQGDNVNYISKIMVERQLSKLEQKLPPEQLKFLYRKFAIFNAVQKNNPIKYGLYLKKLWKLSKYQVVVTLCFVPIQKISLTISVCIKGFLQFLKPVSRAK